jgi:hypothetical protein
MFGNNLFKKGPKKVFIDIFSANSPTKDLGELEVIISNQDSREDVVKTEA